MSPEELCQAYLAEIARLYGEEMGEKSECNYVHGWFYVNLARKWQDGSVGPMGPANPYRRKKLEEMLANLRKRVTGMGELRVAEA